MVKMIFIRMLAYVTHWYQLHFRPLLKINTHFFLNVTISKALDHYFINFFYDNQRQAYADNYTPCNCETETGCNMKKRK